MRFLNIEQGIMRNLLSILFITFPLISFIPMEAPYPPSSVISGIEWAPKETIIRQAKGSDNWPLTWADDDAMYSAYGDGNGFEPFLPEKLSLGFIKVTGTPENFIGENIRSSTGEQRGNNLRGKKSSGMLMVNNVLYMLARNAGNSQIAWSADDAKTWTWNDWRFTESFGCPSFLNFGQNYAGARDEYVYIYSPDANTAYARVNQLVLARVPKNKIRDRSAYEFFVQIKDDGQPLWSVDISKREPVFHNPGACYRTHVVYNPGLKRYILTMAGAGDDTRFSGGFGVYDAPEPWGPWTTVFYTTSWDVGPGESNSFPSKWFSEDGRTGWLVFSGDDCFSVRKARFVLHDEKDSFKTDVDSFDIDWEEASPASLGLNEDYLLKARDYALSGGGAGRIIFRGKKVLEWGDTKKLYDLKSSSKSIGVSVLGIALKDGKVSLDDRATLYHPALGTPPESNLETGWIPRMTLRMLADQTAGFDKPGKDAPLIFEPGTVWSYSDAGPNWLAECLTLVYQRDLNDIIFERIFTPIGISRDDIRWRQHAYRPEKINGISNREFGSGFSANIDALSRIGYLYSKEGKWGSEEILPASFVHTISHPEAKDPVLPSNQPENYGKASQHYSMLWWNNADGKIEGIPRNAFWSWGLYDSLIFIVPELDLVVVRVGGSWPRKPNADHYDVLEPFFVPIVLAVKNK